MHRISLTRALARLVRALALLGFAGILLLAKPLVPRAYAVQWLTLDRHVYAMASYLGVSQYGTYSADGLEQFFATSNPRVEKYESCPPEEGDSCFVGLASATAYQISVMYADGVEYSGATGGRVEGEPYGDFEFESVVRLPFHLDRVYHYTFFGEVDPGDWPQYGQVRGYIRLQGPASYLSIYYLEAGQVSDSGKLGPGDYVLEARSWGDPEMTYEYIKGAVFGGTFVCFPDTTPGLRYDPQDQIVAPGGTATFAVGGAPCAPGSTTYQWRHNLVPLANGGNISGATGPNLTIQNAAGADSGYYDVIVTCSGSNTIPSRFAHLGLAPTSAVAEETLGPPPVMAVSAATPNPFGSATSLTYSAARPIQVRANVYNARGVKVRSLMDEVASGSGTLSWNGETRSGERAAAGIYFVKVEAEGMSETRKVVLLK